MAIIIYSALMFHLYFESLPSSDRAEQTYTRPRYLRN